MKLIPIGIINDYPPLTDYTINITIYYNKINGSSSKYDHSDIYIDNIDRHNFIYLLDEINKIYKMKIKLIKDNMVLTYKYKLNMYVNNSNGNDIKLYVKKHNNDIIILFNNYIKPYYTNKRYCMCFCK